MDLFQRDGTGNDFHSRVLSSFDQSAPTSFACRSPVEVKQNVCKPGELMNRLLLPHTDTIAAAVRQAPDDEATIIMTRPRQLDRHHAPTERLHTPIKR